MHNAEFRYIFASGRGFMLKDLPDANLAAFSSILEKSELYKDTATQDFIRYYIARTRTPDRTTPSALEWMKTAICITSCRAPEKTVGIRILDRIFKNYKNDCGNGLAGLFAGLLSEKSDINFTGFGTDPENACVLFEARCPWEYSDIEKHGTMEVFDICVSVFLKNILGADPGNVTQQISVCIPAERR